MSGGGVVFRNVVKRFGETAALDGVELEVGAGESLALIGPSGAGKTIALKCAAGLVRPDAGGILVGGRETVGVGGAARERIARTGILFQQSALFDSLTVWENVSFRLLRQGRRGRAAAIAAAENGLASVGLDPEVARLYPAELSGGMRKRVGLARTLANDPELLLLDEPTAGLDPVMTTIVDELIRDNVRRLGATAIMVTSNLASARTVADRVAMLHEGRVRWAGRAGDLDSADEPHARQFVRKTPDGPIRAGLA